MSHQQGPVIGDSVDTDQPPGLNLAMIGVMFELERSARLQFQIGPGRARQRAGVSPSSHDLCGLAGLDAVGLQIGQYVRASVNDARAQFVIWAADTFMAMARPGLRFPENIQLFGVVRVVFVRIDGHVAASFG